MKKILISLALVTIASTCWSGSKTTYLYNKDGDRVGFIRENDVNKQIYSRQNGKDVYQGRVSKNSSRSETLWG